MTLTYVEAISLAGDRAKQNDDAFGYARAAAWVIDGATDLHDRPYSGSASDAAWIAHGLNRHLSASVDQGDEHALREALRTGARHLGAVFARFDNMGGIELWESPTSSVLAVGECANGISGVDLGDSRLFALDAKGEVFVAGGPDDAADAETALAAKQSEKEKPLLRRAETIEMLRRMRAGLNQPGARWTFCLDPACADHARAFSWTLARPAHILLMTDGFSALVDRYRAYDAGGLVRAALDNGLQELGREVRAIENADAGGDKHPRFKKSDDATALLMRLS